jgi:hypothetical protein
MPLSGAHTVCDYCILLWPSAYCWLPLWLLCALFVAVSASTTTTTTTTATKVNVNTHRALRNESQVHGSHMNFRCLPLFPVNNSFANGYSSCFITVVRFRQCFSHKYSFRTRSSPAECLAPFVYKRRQLLYRRVSVTGECVCVAVCRCVIGSEDYSGETGHDPSPLCIAFEYLGFFMGD